MPPRLQRYYNFVVIIASRGVGSVIVMALFLIKKYTLPASEFSDLGYAYASAATLLMPFASPLMMIISRRIIQTRDLSRDRWIVVFWACLAFVLALVPVVEVLSRVGGVSDIGFFSSVCGLLLIVALNGQYVIWLNESDHTTRSLIFIAIFILSIPLGMGVRSIAGIGAHDRTFTIETILLCIPVMINCTLVTMTDRTTDVDLYGLSATNYVKYFMVVLFYNGILWADWTLGKMLLPSAPYEQWANARIFMERAVLPVLNIIQVALLWHLLRSSIGQASQTATSVSQQAIRRFQAALAIAIIAAVASGMLASNPALTAIAYLPFVLGYLAFGLNSIFLDFFQAKFTVRSIATSFLAMTLGRVIIVALALEYGSYNLYSVAWSVTSILILAYISRRSWDQIKVGKSQ
jgi:hypothetical protein